MGEDANVLVPSKVDACNAEMLSLVKTVRTRNFKGVRICLQARYNVYVH